MEDLTHRKGRQGRSWVEGSLIKPINETLLQRPQRCLHGAARSPPELRDREEGLLSPCDLLQ
jgi:hypothetical protein